MKNKALKDKKCKQCSKLFPPQRPLQFLCSPYCAYKYAEKNVKIKSEKELSKWRKESKKALLTLTQHESIAKAAFQAYIRKRDEHLPCISCGTTKTNLWDGGHFKKAELYSGVIFNELNCWKQCRKCNRFLGGNELNYMVGLRNRIGEVKLNELLALADESKNYKWSREELEWIAKEYKKKIKEM